MDLAPDFSEFCEFLNAHHVEFVVVGAHALAFHGAPRLTGDLDILVRPTLDNGRRLLSAIAAFGFPTTALTPDDVIAGNKVVEMRNKRAAGRPKDLADIEALRDVAP